MPPQVASFWIAATMERIPTKFTALIQEGLTLLDGGSRYVDPDLERVRCRTLAENYARVVIQRDDMRDRWRDRVLDVRLRAEAGDGVDTARERVADLRDCRHAATSLRYGSINASAIGLSGLALVANPPSPNWIAPNTASEAL